jgi:tetratricopeptide (TPR) repeat protein
MIIVGSMTSKLTASLRQAPATVPALVALALFVVWATSQAGYPVTHWAPGGLIVLVLLVIAVALIGVRWQEMPVAVQVALGCLLAYTALSFLSILWAAVPGVAWEGADRTLLYLLVFALFACWRQTGTTAALLLCAWTLALIALAVFTALHLDATSSAALRSMLPGGRLEYPAGYANANAAQWLMAFWPALLLARSERLPWTLRGLLAGGAVLLAGVALLSQSRGSLYATPVMLVLVFALLPGRVLSFALLLPVAAGIGVSAPSILAVGDKLSSGAVTRGHVHSAITVTLVAAVVVGILVAAGSALQTRRSYSEHVRRQIHRVLAAVAAAALVAVLAGGLIVVGNPAKRVEHAWHTFEVGYSADSTTGSRLISGLGSSRYDFYRVALDEFLAHPVLGIGADNFAEQYLAHGRSEETPHYPHSIELRTLVQTGVIGALLAVIGLGAALLAGVGALRRRDPLARAIAAAALAGFAYWVVHGSFDWFWEFAGLGAPAFAMLGLACALAPARRLRDSPAALAASPAAEPSGPGSAVPPPARRQIRRPHGPRPAIVVGAALVALAAACALAAPWFSELEVESAANIWTRAPATAYARLDEAGRLDPLSDQADLVAGSIALRYDELDRAQQDFSRALERTPGEAYATLELGAIASTQGHQPSALRLLERAAQLDPRDGLTRAALRLARAGRHVDVEELNRAILLKAQQLS